MGLVSEIGQGYRDVGNARAQGLANQGAIWSGTLANLGQIPQQIQQAKAQQQEMQLRQQEIGIRQTQADQAQRQQLAQEALGKAMSMAVKPDGSFDTDLLQRAILADPKTAAQWPKIQEGLLATQEKSGQVAKLNAEARTAERDHMAALANAADTATDPTQKAGLLLAGLASAVREGSIAKDHAVPLLQQMLGADGNPDPQAVTGVLAQMKALSASDTEKRAQAASAAAEQMNRTAALPGIEAESQIKSNVAGTMVGGRTAAQIEDDKRQAAASAATQANQEAERKLSAGRLAVEQARERREGSTNTPLDLTPAGLDAAALNYAKTGQLPPLGMGDKVTRKQIINRAAEIAAGTGEPPRTDLDLASARASFAANEGSLKKLQQQRDAISSFEKTASKNIDTFLQTAGKVVDTGSPLANALARGISGKALGSADQAAYEAARQVALNEVAKIVSNPNLSGALSDSARKEVESFNPSSATLKQSVAVMRILKQDMANRAGAMDEELTAIKGRIGGKSTPASTTDTEGATKPIPGYPGTEQTFRNGKWIRTK